MDYIKAFSICKTYSMLYELNFIINTLTIEEKKWIELKMSASSNKVICLVYLKKHLFETKFSLYIKSIRLQGKLLSNSKSIDNSTFNIPAKNKMTNKMKFP